MRPTNKLRTWSVGLVRSLPVGRSAGPHFTRARLRPIVTMNRYEKSYQFRSCSPQGCDDARHQMSKSRPS